MIDESILQYLAERMRRADAVLFTGAGFSVAARNSRGENLPVGGQLAEAIWPICYPSEPFSSGSRLQDLYQVAKVRNPKQLREVLQARLSVDASSLPQWYGTVFGLPWHRCYTLNVDNLAEAASRAFSLPRPVNPLSAVTWTAHTSPESESGLLDVVHLNGRIAEAPDGVTFSPTQYAERLAGQEPLYAQCAVDVLSRPVVFIGTPLDESPLWQHVAMRRRGPRTQREFRRRSVIVSPSLDRARRELLEKEFHVVHLPMDAEAFVSALAAFAQDAIAEGLATLKSASQRSARQSQLPLVSALLAEAPEGRSDYLLGRSPMWGDIRDGLSADRDAESQLQSAVKSAASKRHPDRPLVLVTGTAGSGKSTAAMKCALTLSASDVRVFWLDASAELSPHDLRRFCSSLTANDIVFIEEAERYGSELPQLCSEFLSAQGSPTLVVTIRSGRGVERFSDRAGVLGLKLQEVVMPPLTDGDIDSLLAVLDRHHRLGELRGLPKSEQIKAFRDVAGREMIVALLQATSGRRFEEMITSELIELTEDPKDIYAVVAVATALRFGLERDELLLALGGGTNATLAGIDALERRYLIARDTGGAYRTRHRVIADVLLKHLSRDGSVGPIVTGLAIAAALKVPPGAKSSHRHMRRLRSILKHDWLVQQLGARAAQDLFVDLEQYLNWSHHYWLQRGSLELEHGQLALAENFLKQAYAIEPNDGLVLTELAYLKLRLAVIEPAPAESRRLLSEGQAELRAAIVARRRLDPHQFHIYGRNGLDWLRRGDVTHSERETVLRDILSVVEQGRKEHPRSEPLREVLVAVQGERLALGRS